MDQSDEVVRVHLYHHMGLWHTALLTQLDGRTERRGMNSYCIREVCKEAKPHEESSDSNSNVNECMRPLHRSRYVQYGCKMTGV